MTNWTILSESYFWNHQQDYYEQHGNDAWSHVPFAITNNAFIAQQYAQLTDTLFTTPAAYIEIGAGRGEFAYHFLSSRQSSGHYWLTDSTNAYVTQWENARDFKFWRYATLHFEQIDCHHFHSPLQNNDTPVVLFANYIFDTLAHDAFILDEMGNIQTLHTCQNPPPDWQTFIELDENSRHPIQAMNAPIPDHLRQYLTQHYPPGSHITVPTGAINLIARLRQLFPKALIIATDKGIDEVSVDEFKNSFSFQKEGSISATVNFHALRHLTTPDVFHITHMDRRFDLNIRTAIIGWGLDPDETDRLNLQFARYEQNTIYDYAMFSREFSIEKNIFSYPFLKHMLVKYNHDPYLFLHMAPNFHQKTLSPSASLKDDFLKLLGNVEQKVFSANHRIIPALAASYRSIGMIDKSFTLLENHRRIHGEDYLYSREMGILNFNQGNFSQAHVLLNNSLKLNPHCTLSQQLIAQINAPVT